jgi:hypothetical protein
VTDLLRILGALLIVLVLLDVFLTVLYARVGAGVISNHLAGATWWTFRTLARPFPRRRDTLLSFCGPSILVLLVGAWVLGLMCGGAMIVQPSLGSGIVTTSGRTPTDFVTALYIVGDSLTTVGTSDFAPRTGALKLFQTFLSLVGISMLTLTLTYFLEIYNALHSRNTFAVKMHHATGSSGDAAELIAGVGPQGQFQAGYNHLTEMAGEMIELFENHHFYAILLYFRFREPHYALARMALITLDTVTLIKSALDDREYAWVKESAAVVQMWRASMEMLTELARVFLPAGCLTMSRASRTSRRSGAGSTVTRSRCSASARPASAPRRTSRSAPTIMLPCAPAGIATSPPSRTTCSIRWTRSTRSAPTPTAPWPPRF